MMATDPAAFGRLCVETSPLSATLKTTGPAAFGRLCVETVSACSAPKPPKPAAFGRLCVETPEFKKEMWLQARQPPSGGCVLKLLAVIALKIFSSSRLRAAVC